jgi:phage terminase large subunit-like protein
MQPTPQQLQSTPFLYAESVRNGSIVTGKKIKLAVERFYQWIETAETDGFTLDHHAGMFAVNFFPKFVNHVEGKMAGKPFELAPFQQFTMYNLFGWKDATGKRRIKTVYDKRAKKNGKTAEMAGLALYCMSFDEEVKAQVYVGATKEEQAKLCWGAAKDFIDSFCANPNLKKMGFRTLQNKIIFDPLNSFMRPLGGDSKTQDGINAHLAIIDEYHAHATDGVKENLESSAVQRLQPITYHITTAGVNTASVCKNYEDSVIEVLEGRKKDDRLWIMIHDMDENDDWQDETNWIKANPLLGIGLEIDNIRDEFTKCVNQPSKIPNFKTKHLNMWVDAPQIWIPNEIWMRNKIATLPLEAFTKNTSFAAVDLSSTTDISAFVIVSEPDEKGFRYINPYFFCPKDTVDRRSKEDRVPYRYWVDAGYMIATPGNVVDYAYIEDKICEVYPDFKINRIEFDKWNATQIVQNLMEKGIEVSYFSQAIGTISGPTKEFEKLVYDGKLLHDGNPVLAWMLASCVIYRDANENYKVHKGQSHANGRRVDGIVAAIMALGGSMSPEVQTSKYSKPMDESEIYI